MFKEAIKLIAEYPEIGKPTNNENARIKIVRNYFIIYEVGNEYISILTIWDSRQDPDELKRILKK